MRSRSNAAAVALTVGIALSGCGDENSGGEIDDQTIANASAAVKGVLTQSEVKCIFTGLADRDFTATQVIQYQQTPHPGPVQDAYVELVPGCIDRTAVVEPVPLSPQIREQLIKGLLSADPGLTREQAGCAVDGLVANGVAPRDLVLGDYDDTIFQQKVEPVVGKVRYCFG